jgi:NCAIR mutase (PurE)-related protein
VPTVLCTKAEVSHADAIRKRLEGKADVHHSEISKMIVIGSQGTRSDESAADKAPQGDLVAVICAGTSDVQIAEEAAVTLEAYGHSVDRHYDVGVAGLHRLLDRIEQIRKARVVIVCAGMDGALPSVVGGLVKVPVIAVPTSVGYGASMEGVAALLAMLNSCSPGVCVVNIDNGFGAGHLASLMVTG